MSTLLREKINPIHANTLTQPTDHELGEALWQVIDGKIGGIAVRHCVSRKVLPGVKPIAERRVDAVLAQLHLRAEEGTVDFTRYPSPVRASELTDLQLAQLPLEDFGITPLHTDSCDELLVSRSTLHTGSARLLVFRPGDELSDLSPLDSHSELHEDTLRALIEPYDVDPARLDPRPTRATVNEPGDVMIFRADWPHMVVSLGGVARRASSQFYSMIDDRDY